MGTTPGREAALREDLVRKLMRLSRRLVTEEEEERAVARFFGPEGPPEPGILDRFGGNRAELLDITWAEWLLHDFRLSDGATVIERFIARRGWTLSPDERAHLEKSKQSVLSAYEVAEVIPEEGLVLNDVFRGGSVRVRERAATRSLVRWDVIGTRLIEVDGALVISGSMIVFPRHEKEALLEGLEQEYARYRQDHPRASKDALLKERGEWLLQFAIRQFAQPLPELVTFDGDPVRLCRATYRLLDREAVLSELGVHPDLEEEESGRFTWLGEAAEQLPPENRALREAGDQRLLDDSARRLVLGSAEVKGERLFLETQSEPRLERFRALVEEAAASSLAHMADTVQDPWAALEEARPNLGEARETGGESEALIRPGEGILPPDVEAQLERELYDEHYRAWLDESIPALGGETPREAVLTKRGRERVADLLRDIENMSERDRLEGRPGYDIGWLWAELGLEEGP